MKSEIREENRKRVFSGCRPSGQLHLGNYLGGIKGYLALQERNDLDCIYAIMDLHGITTPFDPKNFREGANGAVLDYLGAGLDPEKCHLMVQSSVREHIELAYFLGTIYPVSRVEQLPTYKEKKLQNPDYVNVGLLYYPILMAADILLYKSVLVPAGLDQEPHIEVAREVARKFNKMFGPVFPEPQRFETEASCVPSLLGSGKMSKSIKGSAIFLTDDLAVIKEKLTKVPTDSGQGKELPKEGGVATLFFLSEAFLGRESRKELEKEYLGKGLRYAPLKERLAGAIAAELEPIQERRRYFEDRPEKVAEILAAGKEHCQELAQKTMSEVKRAMGFEV